MTTVFCVAAFAIMAGYIAYSFYDIAAQERRDEAARRMAMYREATRGGRRG